MAISLDNPLLNGPRRIDRNTRLLPAPANVAAEEERPVYRRMNKSRHWHPNCDCPEPDSLEFDSFLHGLNAPPHMRVIHLAVN